MLKTAWRATRRVGVSWGRRCTALLLAGALMGKISLAGEPTPGEKKKALGQPTDHAPMCFCHDLGGCLVGKGRGSSAGRPTQDTKHAASYSAACTVNSQPPTIFSFAATTCPHGQPCKNASRRKHSRRYSPCTRSLFLDPPHCQAAGAPPPAPPRAGGARSRRTRGGTADPTWLHICRPWTHG